LRPERVGISSPSRSICEAQRRSAISRLTSQQQQLDATRVADRVVAHDPVPQGSAGFVERPRRIKRSFDRVRDEG
jgi:hypothetical protein